MDIPIERHRRAMRRTCAPAPWTVYSHLNYDLEPLNVERINAVGIVMHALANRLATKYWKESDQRHQGGVVAHNMSPCTHVKNKTKVSNRETKCSWAGSNRRLPTLLCIR